MAGQDVGETKKLQRKRGYKRVAGYVAFGGLVTFITLATVVRHIKPAAVPVKPGMKRRLNRRTMKIAAACLVLGVACTAGAAWFKTMGDDGLRAIVTMSVERPSEATIESDEYVVDRTVPRLITLPTINAEGILQQVARDPSKKIARPVNIHAAGWYTGSALPGDRGLSIINGYIEGRYSKGVFYGIKDLKTGDRFSVTFGDGWVRNFVVRSVDTISVRDEESIVNRHDPMIERQLTLVSAISAYQNGTPASNERVVVTAESQ